MPSKAHVLGHPIHPMLVFFPVAFWILAFVLDVVYEGGGGGADLSQFSYILLISGFAMALVASIPGLIDYGIIEDEYTKQTATSHMSLNLLILLLQAVNIGYRGRAKHGGHYWRNGWILSLVSVVILAISGWLGQELAYVHRMGVKGTRG